LFKTRAEGPDGKVIVTKTQYNLRGLVSDVSLPYFESLETPKWKSFSYDPMERLTEIDYPDGTQVTMTHVKGVTTIIDQNGHKKVEKKDVFGRLVTVEEYSGTSPNFTLYATTLYEHSVLDNLEHIQDAFGNHFRFGYDPMSRKV